MTGECQAIEKSFAIANTGANALGTVFPKTEPGLERLVAKFTGAKPYLSREPWFGCRTVLFLPRR
jgi:hypothetical protein